MEKDKLEELKFEIILLQQKDYQNAINLGFNNKKDWYLYIIEQKQDEIATSIIDLAKRYDVLVENIAGIFDPTMIMRVGKVLQKEIKIQK
ncbi:MAG: hypothetical protein PHF21_02260 [Bacilli bacterium]|nr:hypothetical protein [Bacilli bacterium]